MNKKDYIILKNEIYKSINEIKEKIPDAALYLSKNIIFDDKNMTIQYTGDDRISMRELLETIECQTIS